MRFKDGSSTRIVRTCRVAGTFSKLFTDNLCAPLSEYIPEPTPTRRTVRRPILPRSRLQPDPGSSPRLSLERGARGFLSRGGTRRGVPGRGRGRGAMSPRPSATSRTGLRACLMRYTVRRSSNVKYWYRAIAEHSWAERAKPP